ncbi:hypothetical protein X797_002958 [Metarhizium robertsii]|uniref:Uncharacterized protein n=1 Tax=Metarhizium robertsii TaxID=568076 RepID=A0A0A1V5Y6_9HYPO|nr:hypothetical protein X797_002958 [Metarhizium robertsii]
MHLANLFLLATTAIGAIAQYGEAEYNSIQYDMDSAQYDGAEYDIDDAEFADPVALIGTRGFPVPYEVAKAGECYKLPSPYNRNVNSIDLKTASSCTLYLGFKYTGSGVHAVATVASHAQSVKCSA